MKSTHIHIKLPGNWKLPKMNSKNIYFLFFLGNKYSPLFKLSLTNFMLFLPFLLFIFNRVNHSLKFYNRNPSRAVIIVFAQLLTNSIVTTALINSFPPKGYWKRLGIITTNNVSVWMHSRWIKQHNCCAKRCLTILSYSHHLAFIAGTGVAKSKNVNCCCIAARMEMVRLYLLLKFKGSCS